MKIYIVLTLIIVFCLSGCATTKEPALVTVEGTAKKTTIDIDPRLLDSCPEIKEFEGQDIKDILVNLTALLKQYHACALGKDGLVKVTRDAFNIKPVEIK